MKDKVHLVDLTRYHSGLVSKQDIIKHYSEMIFTAEINIGEVTQYGSVITKKFISNLKERRNELAGEFFSERFGI